LTLKGHWMTEALFDVWSGKNREGERVCWDVQRYMRETLTTCLLSSDWTERYVQFQRYPHVALRLEVNENEVVRRGLTFYACSGCKKTAVKLSWGRCMRLDMYYDWTHTMKGTFIGMSSIQSISFWYLLGV
jgi:hypothetical protein